MLQDIKAGKAALKRVEPAKLRQQTDRAVHEGSLERRLREGLAKFRFDDTASSSVHGDPTEDFSV
jgi:hypothetical protein